VIIIARSAFFLFTHLEVKCTWGEVIVEMAMLGDKHSLRYIVLDFISLNMLPILIIVLPFYL
jgi:hypothetical protein